MFICDLLHTDMNMILNTYISSDTNFDTDLTLRSDLLMLIIDLLQKDINMILHTNISFNINWYLI